MNRARRSMIVVSLCMAAGCIVLATSPASADVRLPHVIGSHMVLQRDMPVPIWGWAEPGEAVTVRIDDHEASVKAGADGKWQVRLPAMAAGGPHTMTVAGRNRIELKDVLVGEVWICSGQSNMDMGIKSVRDADREIASAQYPRIRLLWVPYRTSPDPLDDADVSWLPCSPENVATRGFFNGGFSAVAYFFGRDLHKELNVPIGLIHVAWGGTKIEPWTPRAGFEQVPAVRDFVKVIDEATPNFNKAVRRAVAEYEAWLPKARAAMEANKPVPAPPAWPKHLLEDNGQPSSIYNGMIHALVPFAIRGAIWYQGESNNPDGMLYFEKMKALVGGWRRVWNEGEFPFYYVQIAPLDAVYENDRLPRLWEAQLAALTIPNTGMVVTTDIGDLKDIHPKNKQDVGKRLALWALARTYGRDNLVYSGPLYKSMAVEGDRIRIRFDHVGGGLASRDGKPLNWFEIAGDDRKFVKAEATIDGDSVIVGSPKISAPAAVRFGWNRAAEPNLMNKEGLPASPFRTDRW
ncbi:MAG: sialate O-acetylesterase [Phycisphaerae bacterium]